jgi:hypothetical protein
MLCIPFLHGPSCTSMFEAHKPPMSACPLQEGGPHCTQRWYKYNYSTNKLMPYEDECLATKLSSAGCLC